MQIMLAPAMLSLDTEFAFRMSGFPDSQQLVYGTQAKYPIFTGAHGLDVNMDWVLGHLNFFKYHMLQDTEASLYAAFKHLAPHERPRFWSEKLAQGSGKLGRRWKGSYAYVDENSAIRKVRAGRGDDEMIVDIFQAEGEVFQDFTLSHSDEKNMLWYSIFEKILRSRTTPISRARTRAQKSSASPEGLAAFAPQSFCFHGKGEDKDEDFRASGWLNALPEQCGIPGWQRVTMMKYFWLPGGQSIDWQALWAYEGVVLPGGQIMLGRWWSPNHEEWEDAYSGPFLLWCVDTPGDAVAE